MNPFRCEPATSTRAAIVTTPLGEPGGFSHDLGADGTSHRPRLGQPSPKAWGVCWEAVSRPARGEAGEQSDDLCGDPRVGPVLTIAAFRGEGPWFQRCPQGPGGSTEFKVRSLCSTSGGRRFPHRLKTTVASPDSYGYGKGSWAFPLRGKHLRSPRGASLEPTAKECSCFYPYCLDFGWAIGSNCSGDQPDEAIDWRGRDGCGNFSGNVKGSGRPFRPGESERPRCRDSGLDPDRDDRRGRGLLDGQVGRDASGPGLSRVPGVYPDVREAVPVRGGTRPRQHLGLYPVFAFS